METVNIGEETDGHASDVQVGGLVNDAKVRVVCGCVIITDPEQASVVVLGMLVHRGACRDANVSAQQSAATLHVEMREAGNQLAAEKLRRLSARFRGAIKNSVVGG